jgi:hypothetical protein
MAIEKCGVHRSLIGFLFVSVLAVALSVGTRSDAAGPPTGINATIVNPTSSPVPVSLQGTGSGSNNVTVTNTTSNPVPVSVQAPTAPADPCQSLNVAKQSVTIPNVSPGLCQAIIPASNQTVHVCGFILDGGGFNLRVGTACDTSSASVALTINGTHSYAGPGTIFSAAPNNGVFLDTVGFQQAVSGVVTYTQP